MRAVPIIAAIAAVLCSVRPGEAAEALGSPYAGEQSRSIKALSDDEIAALRDGDGMGLAKAAELNSYPGPRHVLDLAAELRLSQNQIRRMTAVYRQMKAAARALGPELIEREQKLEALFAAGSITRETLHGETAAIGAARARLRAVHLVAHIETRAILSPDQVAEYNRLRGYAGGPAAPPDHSGGHRH